MVVLPLRVQLAACWLREGNRVGDYSRGRSERQERRWPRAWSGAASDGPLTGQAAGLVVSSTYAEEQDGGRGRKPADVQTVSGGAGTLRKGYGHKRCSLQLACDLGLRGSRRAVGGLAQGLVQAPARQRGAPRVYAAVDRERLRPPPAPVVVHDADGARVAVVQSALIACSGVGGRQGAVASMIHTVHVASGVDASARVAAVAGVRSSSTATGTGTRMPACTHRGAPCRRATCASSGRVCRATPSPRARPSRGTSAPGHPCKATTTTTTTMRQDDAPGRAGR